MLQQAHQPMAAFPSLRALPKRRIAMMLGLGLLLTGCEADYPLGVAKRQAAENNTSILSGTITVGSSSAQNSAMKPRIGGFASLNSKARCSTPRWVPAPSAP